MGKSNRFELLKKHAMPFTDKGKGRGVRCDLSIYVYSDGHVRFNPMHVGKNKVSLPNHDLLGAVMAFMDILRSMHIKAKRKKQAGR